MHSNREAAHGSRATRSQRQLRVGEALRHALSRVLQRGELRDPGLSGAHITVTEVRVSPDLRNATVFVMTLAGQNLDDAMAGLKRGASFLKSQIARDVTLRHVPNLAFERDVSFDQADRIGAILARPEVERDLKPAGPPVPPAPRPEE